MPAGLDLLPSTRANFSFEGANYENYQHIAGLQVAALDWFEERSSHAVRS